MFTLRDLIVFLAGAEFFHTLSHVLFYYFHTLPLNLKFIQLTSTMNYWAIVVNAVITIVLLIIAARMKSKMKSKVKRK